MTNTGRRPDGPGAYLYQDVQPVIVERIDGRLQAAYWIRIVTDDGPLFDIDPEYVDDMPGDFIPLTPPVAAPEPSWAEIAALRAETWQPVITGPHGGELVIMCECGDPSCYRALVVTDHGDMTLEIYADYSDKRSGNVQLFDLPDGYALCRKDDTQ